MKLTPTIYNQYKTLSNTFYTRMYDCIYNKVYDTLQDHKKAEALTLDIILSNVLGTVTTFDHVHALIKRDTEVNIIQALEKIRDQIESDSYTADNIQALINKLK